MAKQWVLTGDVSVKSNPKASCVGPFPSEEAAVTWLRSTMGPNVEPDAAEWAIEKGDVVVHEMDAPDASESSVPKLTEALSLGDGGSDWPADLPGLAARIDEIALDQMHGSLGMEATLAALEADVAAGKEPPIKGEVYEIVTGNDPDEEPLSDQRWSQLASAHPSLTALVEREYGIE